jgi:heme/copper-type cytochrome/quinol oxidase subunit 3
MFLIIQYLEFFSLSLTFNHGSVGSIFFMLTGFHGFHVLIGLIFITVVYFRIVGNAHIMPTKKCVLFDITV